MTYVNTLKALSNDSRRGIIEALSTGPLSVGELAERMPISQPAVSQHLKVLANAALVHCHNQGTTHLYSINPDGLQELRRYIDSYWDGVLQAFAASDEPAESADPAISEEMK